MFQQFPQALASRGVDGFHKSYLPRQMRAKLRMRFVILARRSEPYAVVKRSLEPIEIFTNHVRMLIRHQTYHMLPYTLAHDAGLAMIHVESLLHADGRDM